MKSLSFIMAGYNEEKVARESISRVLSTLDKAALDFELILVDDGSKDTTLQIMQEAAEKDERVRVIENGINLNYGASVLRAMAFAKKEYMVYDAFDLEMAPETFLDIFEQMDEDTDCIVFEREGYTATVWRKIASMANRMLLTLLFPRLKKDTPILNHTQLIKRSCFRKIVPISRSPIFFSCELVFRAKLNGLNWKNVKVPFHSICEVRSGAFGKISDIVWALNDMISFRIKLWLHGGRKI